MDQAPLPVYPAHTCRRGNSHWRQCKSPTWGPGCLYCQSRCIAYDYTLSAAIPTGTEPHNEREACSSPDWPHWCRAMQAEVSELLSKQMWTLVNAPMGTNIIGSRWTYHLKRDARRAIACYKARLVVQGFTQTHGINYND